MSFVKSAEGEYAALKAVMWQKPMRLLSYTCLIVSNPHCIFSDFMNGIKTLLFNVGYTNSYDDAPEF